MKTKERIARTNLPVNLPIYNTLILLIALKTFNAPEWMWYGVGAYIVFEWILKIILALNTTEVDVFEFKDKENNQ